MLSTVKNGLFFVSLALFATELIVFIRLKKKLGTQHFEDPFVEQMATMIDAIGAEHLAGYSFLYFVALLFCRIFTPLFSVVITLQLISLSVDVYVFLKIRKH